MSRPWMPFYPGDYFRDTRHLSTVQHGAYFLLLLTYWSRGGLPSDDQQLANITGLSLDEWRVHRPILKAFFYEGWRHKRIDAELTRTTKKIAQAKEAGQKGGLTSALNREKERWRNQGLK